VDFYIVVKPVVYRIPWPN